MAGDNQDYEKEYYLPDEYFTLSRFIRANWLCILVFVIFGVFAFASEAQALPTVVAITCLDGAVIEVDEAMPEVLYSLVYIKKAGWQTDGTYYDYVGWQAPKGERPPSIQKIAFDATLSNGDGALFTISPFYYKHQTALMMVWSGLQPDWRNVGDKNPHPRDISAVSVEDIKDLSRYCENKLQ